MDCQACEDEPSNREDWHCEGGGDYSIFEGNPYHRTIEFDRCPRSYITPDLGAVLCMWERWNRGITPVYGGEWDQPHVLLQAFTVIDGVRSVLMRQERDEMERERARAKAGR